MSWSLGAGLQALAALACIGLLAAAAIGDLRRYRISNNLVGAVVACFAVYAAAKASWVFLAWQLAVAAGVFVVVALLFAFNLFGGGDTKLTTAMALWIPFVDLPRFLAVMTLCGGAMGIIWLARRRRQRAKPSAETAASPPQSPESAAAQRQVGIPNKLPYGVAIAIAGFDFFLFSANSPLVGVISGQ